MTRRAVVLARGLGKRMREADPGIALSREQQRAADAGMKAMMPVNGRPFVDYVLSSLADAGLTDVALVVAPDREVLEAHFKASPPVRLRVSFVVQEAALGTANAVLAAEAWSGRDPFLALNADNLYPLEALRALAAADEPAFPAFDADDLVRSSNIPAERLQAFALTTVDAAGYLVAIVEKPDRPPEGGSHTGEKRTDESRQVEEHEGGRAVAPDAVRARVAAGVSRAISMNCWRFDSRIFDACRDVRRSARGEFELPEAVGLAITRGVRFRAIPARGPVLDLSRRADAADVARRLAGLVPCP